MLAVVQVVSTCLRLALLAGLSAGNTALCLHVCRQGATTDRDKSARDPAVGAQAA